MNTPYPYNTRYATRYAEQQQREYLEKQQREYLEKQQREYLEQIEKEQNILQPGFGSRPSVNSQRICINAANLNAYIQSILNCLDELLRRLKKSVETIENEDGSITTYIWEKNLTREELIEYRQFFPQFTSEMAKATLVENETSYETDKFIPKHLKKIRELEGLGITPHQIYIGWVNGERGGDPLMGTISLLYGILKLKLKNLGIMFGILDDDTNTKKPYIIFGFKHLDPSNPCEASADFTNIEEIIDHVTQLISTIYPDIVGCFKEAKDNFINHKSKRSFGGKRRTKKRKSKRRKTRRRRKY